MCLAMSLILYVRVGKGVITGADYFCAQNAGSFADITIRGDIVVCHVLCDMVICDLYRLCTCIDVCHLIFSPPLDTNLPYKFGYKKKERWGIISSPLNTLACIQVGFLTRHIVGLPCGIYRMHPGCYLIHPRIDVS